MADPAQVYADWVEARSFGCKQCGYTSTNRRVVEQHLRQSHSDLFEGDGGPGNTGASANGSAATARGAVTSPGGQHAHQRPAPPHAAERTGGSGPAIFYTDAGTWENGTRRQRSVLAVWDSRADGIVLHEDLPGTTNNEAEYAAIIAALELARHDRLRGVQIRSDSQLCVKQIKGQYQVKEERLRPLRDRASRLLKEIGGQIDWVPRERNHAGIFLEKKYKH